MKTKVAIIGVTGFAGEKLIEIFSQHPNVEVVNLACRLDAPKPLEQHYPRFKKLVSLNMEPINVDKIIASSDLVFLSLPHTVSFNYVPKFLAAGKTVIDLSADYRLKDVEVYNKYYGVQHTDTANIAKAVYGLPEFNRQQIKSAKLIANPGCYPTVCALSVAPLVKAGLAENIIIDAKSGISGAGRKADLSLNYTAVNANLYAYKVFKHQHLPEINQTLSGLAGKNIEVIFTPHVVPLEQGILATVYLDLVKELSKEEVIKLYQDFYKNEYFVRVLQGLPKLKDVVNTNFCDIGLEVQGKKVIIVATIDNLMRGASSQAVQNMNIVLNLDEKTGLL